MKLEDEAQARRTAAARRADPHCLYCDRLMPRLWWSATRPRKPTDDNGLSYEDYEPKVGDMHLIGFSVDEEPKPVLEVRKRRSGFSAFEVWCGSYKNAGDDDAPFCRVSCSTKFAIAAARAGYVIKREVK